MADVGLDQLSTQDLRVRLVGRFVISARGETSPLQLPAGKATTVLEMLVARRRSWVPADAIVDALWGDSPPPGASRNVAALVSRLRRVVGQDRILGGGAGYRFETAGCWVDVDEAARLVLESEGRQKAGQPALASAASAQARHLLEHGSFLEDQPYAPWAEEGRREAQRLLRRARAVSWTAALVLGEFRGALDAATVAVEADPLDEEAHRARMHALYLAGDAAAALHAHEELRETLAEELGADPSAETEALYLAILRSEPVPPPTSTPPSETAAPSAAAEEMEGREQELAALSSHWTAAVGGRPHIVVVAGPPGAGRTRLAAEAARTARATGGAVLWAPCREAERSLFLQPLLEAVRAFLTTTAPDHARMLAGDRMGTLAALMPELRSVLSAPYERVAPELEHRRSFEALAELVQRLSREQPVLLVLDDAHHAAESTLDAIHFLRTRLSREPVLILATAASPDATDVLTTFGSESKLLQLGPLSVKAVRQLALRLGAGAVDATELHERTGGHTQFVVEALRLAAERPDARHPESLEAAVLERVRRAGRKVDEFLRVAAVFSTPFELDLAAELAGIPVEDAAQRAEHAIRSGLLTTAGAQLDFAGGLLRDVLYASTSAPVRISRHRRAAVHLSDRPEAAAIHHAAAGDWAHAYEAWSAAAEHAVRSFALRDAERLLTEAVASAERAQDRHGVASTRLRRGQLREELADYAGANEDHTAALEAARALADDTLEARALERLGWTAYYGRDSDAASELAARAAELAESAAAAPAALPSALVLVGRVRHWAGDIDGAADAYETALSREPDGSTLASALSCLGALLEHGDRFLDARHCLDRAAAEAARVGAFRPLLRTLFFTGLARANLGDFGGAVRALDRKRRLLEEYDVHFYRARTDTTLSWVRREVGEIELATDLAEQAVTEAREVKAGSLQVEQELHGLLGAAECRLLSGDEDAAAELVAEAEPLLSGWLPFHWRADLRFREMQCHLMPGRAEELLDLARQRRSRKYEALALGHLGRHEEAAVAAVATGSDLVVAEVAPLPQATAAFSRLAKALPADLRRGFLSNGRIARLLAARG